MAVVTRRARRGDGRQAGGHGHGRRVRRVGRDEQGARGQLNGFQEAWHVDDFEWLPRLPSDEPPR